MNAAAAALPACRAVATPMAGRPDTFALRFELSAAGSSSVDLLYAEPFLAFSLRATARDGRAVPVQEPSWDVPSRPGTLTLHPGQAATLRTPAVLHIGPQAAAGGERFARVIAAAKDDVVISARLQLPPPFDADCVVAFE